jgi:hypothetical protein
MGGAGVRSLLCDVCLTLAFVWQIAAPWRCFSSAVVYANKKSVMGPCTPCISSRLVERVIAVCLCRQSQ